MLCAYDAIVLFCVALSSRSEEHTSELQSQSNLVCRLLLEKKKKHYTHSVKVASIIDFSGGLFINLFSFLFKSTINFHHFVLLLLPYSMMFVPSYEIEASVD